MNTSYQAKFVSTAGISQASAQLLAADLVYHGFNHYDYYVPRFNPKMIIFKYSFAATRDQLLKFQQLNDILRKYKCVPHTPIPSQTIGKSEKTIFMWNLNPNYFYCRTTEDGSETNESLDNKKDQLIADIKMRVANRNLSIIDHHFIPHDPTITPKSLKLTFSTKEQADQFNNEDTTTRLGVLLARSKKFDQFVSIRQCAVCRKTDHHKGDPKCDGEDRCPRCLSKTQRT